MNKDIINYNNKGQYHGYQEIYFGDTLLSKCFYYNSIDIDYEEFYYDDCGLQKRFYI